MFQAIWRKIKTAFFSWNDEIGYAIDIGDTRNIIKGVIQIGLAFVSTIAIIALTTYCLTLCADFIFTWIILPILGAYTVVYYISHRNTEPPEIPVNTVEEELLRQRALEQYETMLQLMYYAVNSAAKTTPLSSVHDLFDLKTGSAKEEHFYIAKAGFPVFQFECDLDASIDKSTEDLIQRELQRAVNKQAERFPMLNIAPDGRVPVEVLDIKDCTTHVLIETCLTSEVSIPTIDARRRARIERQRRYGNSNDYDF